MCTRLDASPSASISINYKDNIYWRAKNIWVIRKSLVATLSWNTTDFASCVLISCVSADTQVKSTLYNKGDGMVQNVSRRFFKSSVIYAMLRLSPALRRARGFPTLYDAIHTPMIFAMSVKCVLQYAIIMVRIPVFL